MTSAPAYSNSAKPQQDRWALLGGLRFCLAAIVLACHTSQFAPMPAAVMHVESLGGLAAVIGFLVVSGYSIGHSYEQRPEGFYGRRIDRIYPLYLGAFLLALVPLALGYAEAPSPASLLGNAFLLQGTFAARLVALGPSWTLAIECVCYLLTPLFARLPARALLVLIAASGLTFAFHTRITGLYFSEMRYGMGFACLLWPWLLGFLYVRCPDAPWAKLLLIAVPVGLLTLTPGEEPYAGLTVILACAAVLLCREMTVPFPAALRYAGEISYPLYIFHYPVLMLLAGVGHDLPWVLSLVLPLAVAVLAYHAIDLPYRRYARSRQKKQISATSLPSASSSESLIDAPAHTAR